MEDLEIGLDPLARDVPEEVVHVRDRHAMERAFDGRRHRRAGELGEPGPEPDSRRDGDEHQPGDLRSGRSGLRAEAARDVGVDEQEHPERSRQVGEESVVRGERVHPLEEGQDEEGDEPGAPGTEREPRHGELEGEREPALEVVPRSREPIGHRASAVGMGAVS